MQFFCCGECNLFTVFVVKEVGSGALLLAPQSGEETRRKIADRTRKLGDDLDHKLQGVKDEVKSHSGDFQKALVAGKDAFERARHAKDPEPTNTAM